jgi:hypothetical protein
MMAYSSANSEVIAYTGFTQSYSTGSSPMLSQVESIISQIDGEINVALNAVGITSTPTSTTLLQMLAKYSAMGSAGLVLQRYGQSDADFRVADWWYGKYETWIEKVTTDPKYQEMLKRIANSGYTGIYVSSNVDDNSHEVADAASTEISYGVEGFKI